MNPEITALRKALHALQGKLMAASVRDPGFAEMHSIYWSLSEELIRVGNEDIATIRKRMKETAEKVASEWESSKAALDPWKKALGLVSDALGTVLAVSKAQNPLTALLL